MKNYKYIHGLDVQTRDGNALVCNLKNVETNESVLKIFDDYNVTYYITKPIYRVNYFKKEYEHINKLDMYRCPISSFRKNLANNLGIETYGYIDIRKLLNNPYVYGADIDQRVILKQHLNNNTLNNKPVKIKRGSLDIEQSMLGGNEIILLNYCDDSGKAYCGVYKPFLKEKTLDDIKKDLNKKINKFKSDLNKKALKVFNDLNFNVEFKIFEKELDLISWVFSKIHYHKPDICTIWNLDYDIPVILDRINFRGGNAEDILCHPDVPKKYRWVKYKKDTSKRDHFTYYWHWISISGYTQFIDAMCLYSILRKMKTKENSYSLDYISSKILGAGKVNFGTNKSHSDMQQNDFVGYTSYSVVDPLLVVMLDIILHDIDNLFMLLPHSLLKDFPNQTTQLKNAYYEYCKKNNVISGSVAGSQKTEFDNRILKVGGGVLSPKLVSNTGIPILAESEFETLLHKFVSDLDVSSQYPNTIKKFNIAKESKLFTALDIEGMDKDNIFDFFTNIAAMKENSVYICNKYFDLPNFEEMSKLINV